MKRSALPLVRGRYGPSARVAKAELATAGGECVRGVATAVVGEQALDAHATSGKPGDGAVEERGCGGAAFIGQDLDVRQAGGIIDRHVDKLPAGALLAAASIPRDAMADLIDAPELLHIEVEEFTGMVVDIAPHRLGCSERPQAAEPSPLEPSRDRRSRHPYLCRDLLAGHAGPPQLDHPLDQLRRRAPRHPLRPRRPVHKARRSFMPKARKPPVRGALAQALGLSRLLHRPPQCHHTFHQDRSTRRTASGILVQIHPVPPACGFRHPQHAGSGSDGPLLLLNNLVRFHT